MDLHSNNSFYKAKEKDYLFRIERLSWINEEKKLNPEKFITIFVSKREMIRAKKLAMVNANYQVKALGSRGPFPAAFYLSLSITKEEE